jgi:hypothetical protein
VKLLRYYARTALHQVNPGVKENLSTDSISFEFNRYYIEMAKYLKCGYWRAHMLLNEELPRGRQKKGWLRLVLASRPEGDSLE